MDNSFSTPTYDSALDSALAKLSSLKAEPIHNGYDGGLASRSPTSTYLPSSTVAPSQSKSEFKSTPWGFKSKHFGLTTDAPTNHSEYESFIERKLENDMRNNPNASMEDLRDNGIKQVPGMMRRRRELLDDDFVTNATTITGGIGAVIPYAGDGAPRLASRLGGAQYYAKRFGLRDEDQDPAFRAEIAKATKTDQKAAMKLLRKTGAKQIKKQVVEPVTDFKKAYEDAAAEEAWDTLATHAPHVAEKIAHMADTATDLLPHDHHILSSVKLAYKGGKRLFKGFASTDHNLTRTRDVCEKRSRPVMEDIVRRKSPGVFSRFHRKKDKH